MDFSQYVGKRYRFLKQWGMIPLSGIYEVQDKFWDANPSDPKSPIWMTQCRRVLKNGKLSSARTGYVQIPVTWLSPEREIEYKN